MSDQAILIRSMTEEDIKGVTDINRDLLGEDRALTYDDPSKDTTNTYAIGGRMGLSQVAEAGGRMVGFILGRITTHPYFLEDLGVVTAIAVVPSCHHKGVATRLVQSFKNECRNRGVKEISVLINREDKVMNSFYKTLGFGENNIVELSAHTTEENGLS